MSALADDLNSAGALTILRQAANDGDAAALKAGAQMMGLLTDALGGWDAAPEADLSSLEMSLTNARAAAMETKDFTEVDRLKSALVAAGVEVRMSKAGVELVAGPDFDAGKLDGIV